MRRKIPGRKHRGVRDPLEQLKRKNESLKDKINKAPSNPDFQEIPKSVLEINRLREIVKQMEKRPKTKKKRKNQLIDTRRLDTGGPKLPGMKQRDKVLPTLHQLKGESESSFLARIDSATMDLVNEVKMEKHHNVSVQRDESGHVVKVSKGSPQKSNARPQKVFTGSKSDFKDRGRPFKKKGQNDEPVEKKRMRPGKKQRLKQKSSKIRKEEEKSERKYDEVKFGEVVHAPPALKSRPRGCDASTSAKPGTKNLILKEVLVPKPTISSVKKREMEQNRLAVVKAYRELKAQKNKMKLVNKK